MFKHSLRPTFVFAVLASALVLAAPSSHDVNALEHGHRHHAVNLTQRDMHLHKRFSSARMTWYDVGINACGSFDHANDFIIALNIPQFANGAHCYEEVTINYRGKTAHAKVTDECEGCPINAIDLSTSLFEYLIPGGLDTGTVYDGVWSFGGDGDEDKSTTKSQTSTTTRTTSTPPPPPKTTSSSTTTSTSSTKTKTSSKTTSTSTSTTTTTSTSTTTSSSTTTSTTSTNSAPQATITVMDSGNINQFNLAIVQLVGLSDTILASPNDA